MKKIISIFCLLLGALSAPLAAVPGDSLAMGASGPTRIFVNNRILIQVNGKAISVLDIMKKMDLLFYKQYPEYTSSVPARFQFYEMHWKRVLQDFINKELILADAEENKLPVSQGDIRQEMETLFGPNIILSLDKIGLTYDEAEKMVQEDFIIQRMLYARANSKAFKRVTPQVVKTVYEEYAKTHIRPEQWVYSVITIRNAKENLGAQAADAAYQFLVDGGTFEEVPAMIQKNDSFGKTTKVSTSETFTHDVKQINADHKKVVDALQPDSFSPPIAHKSRSDRSKVFRIFYLKEHQLEGPVPFQEVAAEIRGELLNTALGEETGIYMQRLYKHYHIDPNAFSEDSHEDFVPFLMK